MNLRLPSFWRGMSFVNKAAYLCSTHQARDYSDACRILASLKRRPVARTVPVVARLPYKDLE